MYLVMLSLNIVSKNTEIMNITYVFRQLYTRQAVFNCLSCQCLVSDWKHCDL